MIIDADLFDSENCACNDKNFDKISWWWGSGIFWDCPVHDRETSITFKTRQGTNTKRSLFVIIKKTPIDSVVIICDFDSIPTAIFRGFKTIEDAEVWINQFRRKTTHENKETEKILNAMAGLDSQVINYLMQSKRLDRNGHQTFYFNEEHKIDIANRTDGIVPGLESYRGYKSTTIVHLDKIHHKHIREHDSRCRLKLDEAGSGYLPDFAAEVKAGKEIRFCEIHGVDAFGGVNNDIRFFVYHHFKQGDGCVSYKKHGLNFYHRGKIYLRLKKLEGGYVVMQKGNKKVKIDAFKSWWDAKKWVEEMLRNPVAADKAFVEICSDIMKKKIQGLPHIHNTFITNALTHALSLGPNEAVMWAKVLLEILENRLDDNLKKYEDLLTALDENDTSILGMPGWLQEASVNSRIEDIEQLIKNVDIFRETLLQKLACAQQSKKF